MSCDQYIHDLQEAEEERKEREDNARKLSQSQERETELKMQIEHLQSQLQQVRPQRWYHICKELCCINSHRCMCFSMHCNMLTGHVLQLWRKCNINYIYEALIYIHVHM